MAIIDNGTSKWNYRSTYGTSVVLERFNAGNWGTVVGRGLGKDDKCVIVKKEQHQEG